MAKYSYTQHPHAAERRHLPTHSHIRGLNNRIGLWITERMGTMWAAYAFAVLVLVSVIIVGQNQMNRQAEIRAEATYKDATALLHEVQQLQQHLAHQDAQIERLLRAVGGRG